MALSYFKFLSLQTGMTNEEMGQFLDRPKSAIEDYQRGKGRVPDGAILKLLDLIDHIDEYAQSHAIKILELMEKKPKISENLPIPVSPTDEISRQIGFPFRSCENMATGKLIANFPEDMIEKLVFVERPPVFNN